jgi:dipeptidyl aminopeptidase/acylaminoacyl peptidase
MMLRAALAICVLALLVPATAGATFPGRNGKLTATVEGCQSKRHIVAIRPGVAGLQTLTPACAGDPRYRRDTFGPQWLPDGRRFLFVDATGPPRPEGLAFVTANPAGANERVGPRVGAKDPSLSPDGKRFVFSRNNGLFGVGVDGGDPTTLVPERTCVDTPGGFVAGDCYLANPRWSPDGRYFAVVWSGRRADREDYGLWIFNARNARPLRRLAGASEWFDWAPDSRRVVFATYGARADSGHVTGGNLYLARADGGGLRRIVRRDGTAETAPVISPDNRWVAWISLRFGPGDLGFTVTPTVWRRRLSGGPSQRLAALPRPVVDETFYTSPDLSWQPLP